MKKRYDSLSSSVVAAMNVGLVNPEPDWRHKLREQITCPQPALRNKRRTRVC
jgi:hypothetical protein